MYKFTLGERLGHPERHYRLGRAVRCCSRAGRDLFFYCDPKEADKSETMKEQLIFMKRNDVSTSST
jgi:hypothetical protein